MGSEEASTMWLLVVGVVGFGLSYILTKAKIVNEKNLYKFTNGLSAFFAFFVACSIDGVSGVSGFLGRVAVFFLVWLIGGIFLGFGVLLGNSKAEKK